MILVDANLLLHAYNPSSAHHERARLWLRVITHPRVFAHPFTIDEASAVVAAWLSRPTVGLVGPGERHWGILRNLLVATQSRGPAVMDVHLAALAIEHGTVLCTTDRDFARFPGLRVENPIL